MEYGLWMLKVLVKGIKSVTMTLDILDYCLDLNEWDMVGLDWIRYNGVWGNRIKGGSTLYYIKGKEWIE